MRIALVSPKWNEMVNSYPPLGLGYLAAVLERVGHEVLIFDLGLEPHTSLEQQAGRIAAWAPELVGVTAMTNNYHSAEDTIRLLKDRLKCQVVVGGPHATVFPEKVVSDVHVDYVVCGEGEETLLELAQALCEADGARPDDERLAAIQGLCFLPQGQDGSRSARCNPARALIKDLDSLPFPARHLFELSRYPLFSSDGEPMVTLLSSRGCPYNCSYCFKGIVGRTYRQRSPQNVIAEIQQLKSDYGYANYYFIDDLFTLDRKRLESLTDMLIEQRLGIRWQCLARVDRVTPEILQQMHRAGCYEVHYGIESGNPQILASIDKGINMDQVRRAVAATAQAGIMAKGYFMLGLPGDSEATMRQTIRFAGELELEQAMFSLTTPFPGTRLWDELVRRRPTSELTQSFTRAAYYVNYEHMVKPFVNLSDVSDDRLSELVLEAKGSFQEAKRRRKYLRALGPFAGRVAYGLSRVRAIRLLGRRLMRASILRRWHVLRAIGARTAQRGT